jgi:hypothetical protein
METFVILTGILLAVGAFVWFWQTHSCSICHRFHYHDHEYQRCEECGKRFCADRVDRDEKIIETISGVLGTTTRTIKTWEIKCPGRPCGYEFITTVHHGSSTHYYRCAIHRFGRSTSRRQPVVPPADFPRGTTSRLRSRETHGWQPRHNIVQGRGVTRRSRIEHPRSGENLPETRPPLRTRRQPDRPDVNKKKDESWK